jgi:regulator of cell morphogenesis and NO signaling
MTITPETQIAELATAHPATVRVFQRYGIDFCCGGRRPLERACDERGIAFEALRSEIEAALATEPTRPAIDWRAAPATDLIAHIVERYHAPQRDELARLEPMMTKVLRVHGDRWPAMLRPLAAAFDELKAEATSHTADEEERVFPMIAALEAHAVVDTAALADVVDNLEREHARMGALLAEIQRLTDGYQPPEGACNTFRALFHGLHELTDALHEHVHLENHVLFPKTAALAAGGAAAARS